MAWPTLPTQPGPYITLKWVCEHKRPTGVAFAAPRSWRCRCDHCSERDMAVLDIITLPASVYPAG